MDVPGASGLMPVRAGFKHEKLSVWVQNAFGKLKASTEMYARNAQSWSNRYMKFFFSLFYFLLYFIVLSAK